MHESIKEIVYPVRVNRYLAIRNICSRKEADQFIEKGKVKINGRLAVLGDKVKEGDRVELDEKEKAGRQKRLLYLAFNKPQGIVTHSPQKREKSIKDIFPSSAKLFPIGRLDKDSYGLIILTNDGRITDKLLNPKNYHEKEYIVRVDKKITTSFIRHLMAGVELEDGYVTRPCQVKKREDFSFSIILTEGKKRQIRRMCERLGKNVVSLKRERIMNIKLNNLKSGQGREIREKELTIFLENIGLSHN